MAGRSDSFAIIVVGIVFAVAALAVLFVEGDLPMRSGTNVIGRAAGDIADPMFLSYAPPIDPITNDTYLSAATTGTGPLPDLIIVAQGRDRYIYHEGFYLKDGAWEKFSFNGVRAGSWIQESASALVPHAPPNGYVLAYVCKQYEHVFRCGVASVGQDPSDRRWTLAPYGSLAACLDDARHLCAASPPQNGTAADDKTCAAGSCYRCNEGKIVNRSTGRCDNPAPAAQCMADARQLCAALQPQNGTQGSGSCVSGSCYRCNEGKIVNRTTLTCDNPFACPSVCALGQKRCDPNHAFKAQECQLVNGCPQWHTYATCGMSPTPGQCVSGVCVPDTNAETSASACQATPDATQRDTVHYGSGPGGDQGIAFLSPWKGDSAGTSSCCGNQQGEYLLAQRFPGQQPSATVRACCDNQNDCVDTDGVCVQNQFFMPSSVAGPRTNFKFCFYNGIYACNAANLCIGRNVAESQVDCYGLHNSDGTNEYYWGVKQSTASTPATLQKPQEHCSDGIDNDCNGQVDCQDSACAQTAGCAGQSQNLRLKRVSIKSTGNGNALSVEVCRDASPLIGTSEVSFLIQSQKTYRLDSVLTSNIPLCTASAGWDHWVTLGEVFTSTAPGQRTVSVTATFPPQYNSVAGDDALQNVAVTIP